MNEFEIFLQKLEKYYEICEKYRIWRKNDGWFGIYSKIF